MVCIYVWLADYDNEIYTDGDMVMVIDDNADSQSSEVTLQLNHVYNKVNGDIENDLDASNTMKQHMLIGTNTVRRQSSVGAINGLKTHEHNIILQRMAIIEVKKPGKGSICLDMLLCTSNEHQVLWRGNMLLYCVNVKQYFMTVLCTMVM